MSDEQQTPPQGQRPEDKFIEDVRAKGEELKGTLKEWGIDLDQFMDRANQAGEDAKTQFMHVFDELQATVNKQSEKTSKQAPDVPPQTKEAAQDFFTEMEAAFKDIQQGFEAAGQRLHKQLDTAIERSKETAEERGERLGEEADDLMDKISGMRDDLSDDEDNV
jgi:gas vesicle protein